MPDEESGKNINQNPQDHVEESKPISPPMPPDNPYPERAESVRNEGEAAKIQPLENRIRHGEKWMIAITGAIALFGLCSVVVGFQQWNTMQGQLGVMEDQIQMTGRPWIKVLDVTTRGSTPPITALSFQHIGPFGDVSEQAFFQLHVSVKNVGHSVATHMNFGYDLFLPPWRGGGNGYRLSIFAEQKRFCGSFFAAKPDFNRQGTVIFPDEQFDAYGGVGIGIRPRSINYLPDRPGIGFVIPVVIGCINYQSGSSPTIYQTRFLYEIYHSGGDRSLFFEIGQGVPAEQLRLIRDQEGDKVF